MVGFDGHPTLPRGTLISSTVSPHVSHYHISTLPYVALQIFLCPFQSTF